VLGAALTSCSSEPPPDEAAEVRLVQSLPDAEAESIIRERDTSVRPGDLYSFVSTGVCLTAPGTARVTGAELGADSIGLEVVDVRVRRPVYGGFGSARGPLDRLPFVATPGNEVHTVCARHGGTENPPMDQTGVTVRRTSRTTGRATRIRFLYSVDGHEERTGWFRCYWRLGRPTAAR
jgi:hypothetical protein